MRMFKTSFGDEVDLDDPNTYSYLPNSTKELDSMMFKEIGYTTCYMDYWHLNVFPKRLPGNIKYQRTRVENLIKNFTDNRHNNYDNVLWYKEQIFIFTDETENMC